MENKELRMSTEISKIIINTLQSEGGVYLPKIGSITKGRESGDLLLTNDRRTTPR